MISKSEIRFAARLVHLGLVSKEDMQAVLSDLNHNRDSRLDSSLDEILVERGHVTKTEIPLIKEKEEADDTFPVVRVDGFAVKEMVGEGGMSRVYRAVPKAGGTPVALKILRPHIARQAIHVERFYREAELLIGFAHPNLVRGYEVWESDGLHCFTMEHVDGAAIQEEIDRGRRFDEDQVLSVILQAARALVYLSEQGITHRDIKPGNLLLGSDGVVKLIDLGLAQDSFRRGDGLQREGTTVGTVQYVSPEQARGEALDVRADIYSLGVSLYHMVTGEVPFEGESDRDILRQQVHESLKSPRAKDRRITPHLHYFIEKMMAKDRALRYQNAEALIADIEEKIQGREEVMLKGMRGIERAPDDAPTRKKAIAPPERKAGSSASARARRRRRRGRFGR